MMTIPAPKRPTLGAKSHVFALVPQVPAESMIVPELVQPNMRALDVGCGAVGRTTKLLRSYGARVHAIDINQQSVLAASRVLSKQSESWFQTADMLRLPYGNACFGICLIATIGVDYLCSRELRRAAWREMSRVLVPGGHLVFSSSNRIGMVTSTRGAFHSRYLKWRVRQILTGGILDETFIDLNGLRLYQSLPSSVIREVTTVTDMKFLYSLSSRGHTKNLLLQALFAKSPYFVFRK